MSGPEHHFVHRSGWLRAGVLGANDGIVSTASLITGVASAGSSTDTILLTAVAGLCAGALSMAAGEYVSVSSQSDTERADLDKERIALASHPRWEHAELTQIYVDRGLSPVLAAEVARQLTRHNALDAHARDELGINPNTRARPAQAALASALSFALGAAIPAACAAFAPVERTSWVVTAGSLCALALLGITSARAGGAPPARAALRVVALGAMAMGLTAVLGNAFGVALG